MNSHILLEIQNLVAYIKTNSFPDLPNQFGELELECPLILPKIPRRTFMEICSTTGACCLAGSLSAEELEFSQADRLTVDRFAPLVGSRFRVKLDGVSVAEMELSEVTPSKHEAPIGHRKSFSLIFRVVGQARLPQAVYQVHHPKLETFGQLLVPVDSPTQSNNMQIVFS